MNLLPRPRHVDLSDRLAPNTVLRERTDPSIPREGYELQIGDAGVDIVGADEAGLF